MAKYQVINDFTILLKTTGQFFPKAPGNPQYDEYVEWILAGGEADPPDVKPVTDPDEAVQMKHLVKRLRKVVKFLKKQFPDSDIEDI